MDIGHSCTLPFTAAGEMETWTGLLIALSLGSHVDFTSATVAWGQELHVQLCLWLLCKKIYTYNNGQECLPSETYVCEGGASGVGRPAADDQVLTKPIQETGDDHANVDDDVEKDVMKREGRVQYQMQSAENDVKRVHGENM